MARKKVMAQAEYDEEISKVKTKIADLEQKIKEQETELTRLELAKMTQYLKDTEIDGKSLYDQYTEKK